VPAAAAVAAQLALALGVLAVVGHTLVTDAAQLTGDFRTDAMYIAQQAHGLQQNHAPSLFLTYDPAAFYPIFAFYGGTFLTFTALIALLVGSAMTAEVIVILAGLAAAYGGWYWLARLAGVRPWPAHAPAIVYVTAPYLVTNVYVRHDLPEQVATSFIPLMVASAISVAKARSWPAWPTVAFAVCVVVFGGTHNLTLLWGTTLLVVAGLLVATLVPAARGLVTRAGLLRLAIVAVPAMLLNAWYLVPDLVYGSQTVIAHRLPEWKAALHESHPEQGLGRLLTPHQYDDATGGGFALPALALAWTAVAAVVAGGRRRGTWGRLLALAWIVTGVLAVAISHPTSLLALPDPWLLIQGSGRLCSYATFGVACAVIAALRMTGHVRGWFTFLLPACLLVGGVLAVAQIQHMPRLDGPATPIEETVSVSLGDYGDGHSRPLDEAIADAPYVGFARGDVRGNVADVTMPHGVGSIVRTNLLVPADLLRIRGAHVIGRWPAAGVLPGSPPRWYLAIQIDDRAVDGQAHVVVSATRAWPLAAGKLLSLLGVLGLVAGAAALGRSRLRTRRGA
jgi:hypothetical protein